MSLLKIARVTQQEVDHASGHVICSEETAERPQSAAFREWVLEDAEREETDSVPR